MKKNLNITAEVILKLKAEGLTQGQIGERLGCSPSNISYFSRKYEIEFPLCGIKDGLSRSTIERRTRRILSELGRDLHLCERCGYVDKFQELPRHHKDRNRTNNEVGNLEVICKTCHMMEHSLERQRDPITGQFTNE